MLALQSALAVAWRPALRARHRRPFRAGPRRCSAQAIVRGSGAASSGLTQQDSSSSTRRKLGAPICSRCSAMVPRDSRVRNGTCWRSASCSACPWSLSSGADWQLKAYFAALLLQLPTITACSFSWCINQCLMEHAFSSYSRIRIAHRLCTGSRSERVAARLHAQPQPSPHLPASLLPWPSVSMRPSPPLLPGAELQPSPFPPAPPPFASRRPPMTADAVAATRAARSCS
jgi:hypothetical protein